jgi:hypothetical protein
MHDTNRPGIILFKMPPSGIKSIHVATHWVDNIGDFQEEMELFYKRIQILAGLTYFEVAVFGQMLPITRHVTM